jgi:hypothetical protein
MRSLITLPMAVAAAPPVRAAATMAARGASRRDHRKSRAQCADERPEHDGGNAREIIPSNQIAAREARGFRDLDRIPIDRSQLPDDGVMTGH